MGTTVTEIMELADMHAYAQIADGTPARMLPRNLLQSKVEALIDLHTENEQLRAGYAAARLEIARLRERVQQLGQLARDVNSRRVTELEAQLAAVGAGGVGALRPPSCWCESCDTAANRGLRSRMSLCSQCGNKRCPRAKNHTDACANAAATAQPVAQDAERYRWLRDHRGWQVLHRIRPGKSIEYRMRDDGDWWGSWWPTHEQAIDAARAAQKGTND